MKWRVNSFIAAVVFPFSMLLLVAIACQPPMPGKPIALRPIDQVVAPLPVPMSSKVVRPKLIVFSATWCQPCQAAKPTVAKIEALGIEVVRYDIDTQPEMAAKYGVTRVPMFFVYEKIPGETTEKQTFRTQSVADALARLTHGITQQALSELP